MLALRSVHCGDHDADPAATSQTQDFPGLRLTLSEEVAAERNGELSNPTSPDGGSPDAGVSDAGLPPENPICVNQVDLLRRVGGNGSRSPATSISHRSREVSSGLGLGQPRTR